MASDPLVPVLERIRQDASLLSAIEDTLVLDKLLGQIALTIGDARLLIDDEWREARARNKLLTPARASRTIIPTRPTTLDDLI